MSTARGAATRSRFGPPPPPPPSSSSSSSSPSSTTTCIGARGVVEGDDASVAARGRRNPPNGGTGNRESVGRSRTTAFQSCRKKLLRRPMVEDARGRIAGSPASEPLPSRITAGADEGASPSSPGSGLPVRLPVSPPSAATLTNGSAKAAGNNKSASVDARRRGVRGVPGVRGVRGVRGEVAAAKRDEDNMEGRRRPPVGFATNGTVGVSGRSASDAPPPDMSRSDNMNTPMRHSCGRAHGSFLSGKRQNHPTTHSKTKNQGRH